MAVTQEQIGTLGLTPLPGKRSDARAAGFEVRHGQLVQVEVEAIHPDTLRGLHQAAIEPYWDVSTFDRVCEQEDREREALRNGWR